jgi:hypothetical protein
MRGGVRRSAFGFPGARACGLRQAWVVLAALVFAGCSQEGPPTLRLLINAELSVPTDLDELWITIAASRTLEGNICEPVTRVFTLDRQTDLPLPVSIEMGEVYTEFAIYRIVGKVGGVEVFRRETWAMWPSSGTVDAEVLFDAACLDPERPPCGEGLQCVDNQCVGIRDPGILEDLGRRDRGVSCDSAAEVEDVGIPEGDGDGGLEGDGRSDGDGGFDGDRGFEGDGGYDGDRGADGRREDGGPEA